MVALEYRFAERDAAPASGRLKVGVLVDLVRGPRAGGHVKCWERLAEAATGLGDLVDMTVHFSGDAPAVETLAENVRFVTEPPVFSTARIPFLAHAPDHTDLSPWHPRLARHLVHYDVIHTTDAFFAYARTALRLARREGVPLVTSVHTNTPEYTRLYTAATVERLFGRGAFGRFLTGRLALDCQAERFMRGRLQSYQRRCDFVLVSRPAELVAAQAVFSDKAGLLRRGINRRLFDPARRDRDWLARNLGVPRDRVTVMFAGRLNRGKNVRLLADAVAAAAEGGLPVHLLCAGDGDERAAIAARLGERVSLPGSLSPDDMARAYASADLFALPSQIEEAANVVFEALASGLPVLVAAEGGMGRAISDGETGLALPGEEVSAWAGAIAALVRDEPRRRRMSAAARRHAETRLPSWEEVLTEDLLPRWRAAAARRWGEWGARDRLCGAS